MHKRLIIPVVASTILLLSACDSNNEGSSCFEVTPNESYNISGAQGTTTFTPASKAYTVRNNCSDSAELSVEEDVRWLDVDIAAFGDNEFGTVQASSSVIVIVEVRYGSDLPDRLDQLPGGTYQTPVEFIDDTNDGSTSRSVNLTVN